MLVLQSRDWTIEFFFPDERARIRLTPGLETIFSVGPSPFRPGSWQFCTLLHARG